MVSSGAGEQEPGCGGRVGGGLTSGVLLHTSSLYVSFSFLALLPLCLPTFLPLLTRLSASRLVGKKGCFLLHPLFSWFRLCFTEHSANCVWPFPPCLATRVKVSVVLQRAGAQASANLSRSGCQLFVTPILVLGRPCSALAGLAGGGHCPGLVAPQAGALLKPGQPGSLAPAVPLLTLWFGQ